MFKQGKVKEVEVFEDKWVCRRGGVVEEGRGNGSVIRTPGGANSVLSAAPGGAVKHFLNSYHQPLQ